MPEVLGAMKIPEDRLSLRGDYLGQRVLLEVDTDRAPFSPCGAPDLKICRDGQYLGEYHVMPNTLLKVSLSSSQATEFWAELRNGSVLPVRIFKGEPNDWNKVVELDF